MTKDEILAMTREQIFRAVRPVESMECPECGTNQNVSPIQWIEKCGEMRTSETVTVILPLPPACLSPNRPTGSRGGRMKRAAALKRCRKLACIAVHAEHIDTAPWTRVTAKATFHHKQKRRRDGANFNAMLKGYCDGIVDAGLVVDDDATHWTTLPPEFCVDKDLSRVELVIERLG